MKVWLNGRILDEARAVIAATDPGVLYGWGVFEVLRTYGGAPFRLDDHLERVRRSAKAFTVPVPRADYAAAIRSLCRANRLPDAYVRLTFTRGGAALIQVKPLPPAPKSGRVRVAPWVHDPEAPLHGHKTLNYLENYLVRNATRQAGDAETIFVDPDGCVLEGTVTNVFLVKRGSLVTPGLEGVLPGVTRKVVFEIAERIGVRVRQKRVKLDDLARADEAFLTNALIEVVPITAVAGIRIPGPGAVTARVAEAYRALTAGDRRPERGPSRWPSRASR